MLAALTHSLCGLVKIGMYPVELSCADFLLGCVLFLIVKSIELFTLITCRLCDLVCVGEAFSLLNFDSTEFTAEDIRNFLLVQMS